MPSSRIRNKLRAFVRFLTTSPKPLDPDEHYPVKVRYAVLWIVLGIAVEWYYFAVQVSYDSIPNKPSFWASLVAWALPGIVTEWRYRNLPTAKLIDKYANFMIGIGLSAIILGVASKRTTAVVLPVAYALLPGFIAGAGIGSESLLVWRLLKKRRRANDDPESKNVSL